MKDAPTTMDNLVRAVARVDSGPTFAPGQVLDGAYELVERLGGGGMGIVYRARDAKLGRDVAIKLLRNKGDADLRRMFEREARATAQLLHPNIVTLHHVGEHEGHPFLVLELLSGETLAARLSRRGKLPVAEALTILDGVLGALAFAHERGVVHRDLKPNNVFLTGDQRVKVLDFGVALPLDTSPGPATRAAGTPGYMAPEQRDGKEQDARTDVWAAALLLLECLLGRRTTAQSVADISAPGPVRELLGRALSADPAGRPDSAAELRAALSRAAGKMAPSPPTNKPWRRRLELFVIVVIAVIVAGFLGYELHRAPTDSTIGAAPTNAEMNTVWKGRFGILELHVDDDGTAYGVYEHENGILEGHYANGILTGWWCEEPTRRPSDDAGLVEIQFVKGARRILYDGQWKYGSDTKALWVRDWNGFNHEAPPAPELDQRMQRHVTCPRP